MNNPFNKLNLKSILIISVLVITIIVFRFYVNRGLETSIGMGGFILISLTLFYLSYSSNLISKSQRNKWLFTITFTLILLISSYILLFSKNPELKRVVWVWWVVPITILISQMNKENKKVINS
jgi:hypothetical protein